MRDINERSFFSKRTASKKGSLFKSQKIIVSKLKKPTMKTHNIQVKEEEKSHIFEEPKEDIDNSNNIQSNYQSSLKKSTNCTDSSDEGLSPKNINKSASLRCNSTILNKLLFAECESDITTILIHKSPDFFIDCNSSVLL